MNDRGSRFIEGSTLWKISQSQKRRLGLRKILKQIDDLEQDFSLGRTSKTRATYKLMQHAKYVGTRPERFVDKLLKEMGYFPKADISLSLQDGEGMIWKFQIDHYLENRTIVSTDGPYHQTEIVRKKDMWKDEVIKRNNYKHIHVPSELCCAHYREYLANELKKAIESPEQTIYIRA